MFDSKWNVREALAAAVVVASLGIAVAVQAQVRDKHGDDVITACPVPATRVDVTTWQEIRARNAPFTIRLPSEAKDAFAEHRHVAQVWQVGPDNRYWDIVYHRPGLPSEAVSPFSEPAGIGVTRHQDIQYGPCTERIGGRDVTVWLGSWLNRGIHSHLRYQVIASWKLESGETLYILGQGNSEEERDRALAALRSVRITAP